MVCVLLYHNEYFVADFMLCFALATRRLRAKLDSIITMDRFMIEWETIMTCFVKCSGLHKYASCVHSKVFCLVMDYIPLPRKKGTIYNLICEQSWKVCW